MDRQQGLEQPRESPGRPGEKLQGSLSRRVETVKHGADLTCGLCNQGTGRKEREGGRGEGPEEGGWAQSWASGWQRRAEPLGKGVGWVRSAEDLAAAEGPSWVRKGGGRRRLVGCVPVLPAGSLCAGQMRALRMEVREQSPGLELVGPV